MDLTQFSGKTALVTGGAGQIGTALASALLDAGLSVILADQEGAAWDTALQEEEAPGRLARIALDVTQEADWERAVAFAKDFASPIALLCNNAGVAGSRQGRVDEIPLVDFRRTMEINTFGVLLGVQAVLPGMIAAGAGHIINTASVGALVGSKMRGDYCASKAAVLSLTETLRAELAPLGIGVSALCPGATGHKVGDAGSGSAGRLAPVESVRRALALAEKGKFYLFTHPEDRQAADQKLIEIRGSFEVLEGQIVNT
jgi:NAD(P)-dependent dehydrogenase (short-subunit alcohol dehydrogenase family)